jgi:hypothetical protein
MKKVGKVLIGIASFGALVGTGYAAWTINYGNYGTKTSLIEPEVIIKNHASFGEFVVTLVEEEGKTSPITFDAPEHVLSNGQDLGFVGGKEDLDVTYNLKALPKDKDGATIDELDPYSLGSVPRTAYDGIASEYIPDVTVSTKVLDAQGVELSEEKLNQIKKFVLTPEQAKGEAITVPYEEWLAASNKEKGYDLTLHFGWGEGSGNINPQIYFIQEENHKTAEEFERYINELNEVVNNSGIKFQFTFAIGEVEIYSQEASFRVDVSSSHVNLEFDKDITGEFKAGDKIKLVKAEAEEGYENPVVKFNDKEVAVGGEFTIVRSGNRLVATATPKDATVSVTGVSLNKEKVTLKVGEEETLVATVLPENATNKAVTWSVSGDAAKVENGKVTALKEGEATVTVTTVDGSKTASATVTVTGEETPVGEKGTETNPYTAAEAATIGKGLADKEVTSEKFFIKDTVSEVKEISSKYGNMTLVIGEGDNAFTVFRAKAVSGTTLTEDYVQVGDVITIESAITNYGGTPETVASMPLIQIIRDGQDLYKITSITAELGTAAIKVDGFTSLTVKNNFGGEVSNFELVEKSSNFDQIVKVEGVKFTGLAEGTVKFKVSSFNLLSTEITLTVEKKDDSQAELTLVGDYSFVNYTAHASSNFGTGCRAFTDGEEITDLFNSSVSCVTKAVAKGKLYTGSTENGVTAFKFNTGSAFTGELVLTTNKGIRKVEVDAVAWNNDSANIVICGTTINVLHNDSVTTDTYTVEDLAELSEITIACKQKRIIVTGIRLYA